MRAAEDRFPPVGGKSAVEHCVIRHWPGHQTHGLPQELAPGPVLAAFVNHGRWIVQCPGCPLVSLASRQDHRFFCSECGNALDGGRWLPVRWPEDWETIEQVLGARLDRRTRNWSPGERIEELRAENVANGVI